MNPLTERTGANTATVAPELQRNRRLLWFGMALAMALPLLAVWLLVHDHQEQRDLAAARSQLLVEAVQRQARERLELLSHQLEMHAARAGEAAATGTSEAHASLPIPLTELRTQPVDRAGAAPGRLQLGAPVREGGRWVVPVGSDGPRGLRVSGKVDAAWFAEIVEG